MADPAAPTFGYIGMGMTGSAKAEHLTTFTPGVRKG